MQKKRKLRVENLSNLRRFLTKILTDLHTETETNYDKVRTIIATAKLLKEILNAETLIKLQQPTTNETEMNETEMNDVLDKLKRML